jgi:hypothetical protein
MFRFFAERECPIYVSEYPVSTAVAQRFCSDRETSELFRPGPITLCLRLHGRNFRLRPHRLTCRRKPLFPAGRILISGRTRPRQQTLPRSH